MIDAVELFAEARNKYGYQGTFSDVQRALESVDRAQIEEEEARHFAFEIWDETTQIAGMTPEEFRQHVGRELPAGGKVYFILFDGHRRIIQTHDPEELGYIAMDEDTARARASKVVSTLVERAVDARVQQQVLAQLLTE